MFPYKKILCFLSVHDEFSLCYIYGKKLDKIPQLLMDKKSVAGWLYTILRFLNFLFKNSLIKNWMCETHLRETDCLFFWGTKNQYDSTRACFDKTSSSGVKCLSLTDFKYLKQSTDVTMMFNLKDMLRGLKLLVARLTPLNKSIKNNKNHQVIVDKYLSVFLEPYFYIAYFYRVLEKSRPKVVVMSNDHNPINRSLLFVCELLDIKTAYMQHANVTELYPPLAFDYALLDGIKAAEVYQKCSLNSGSSKTIVFLSGQKKILLSNFKRAKSNLTIGIAINATDDINIFKAFVTNLNSKIDYVIRWHPGQKESDIEMLMNEIINVHFNIDYSDPKLEPQNLYFGRIDVLIAGNTSLHLEASLANIKCFYQMNTKDSINFDYYGFVGHGMIRLLPDKFSDFTLAKIEHLISDYKMRNEILKEYSETFSTQFEGHEAELSALIVQSIITNDFSNLPFNANCESLGFKAVFGLRC